MTDAEMSKEDAVRRDLAATEAALLNLKARLNMLHSDVETCLRTVQRAMADMDR